MNRCARIKEDGERCRARAMEGSQWCYNHDPSRADERKRHARRGGEKGGNGRPGLPELRQIRREVREVMANTRAGSLDKDRASTILRGYHVLLRAVEAERRYIETDELLTRLEALEEQARERRGPRDPSRSRTAGR